tara:strand:- start:6 stop:140 length:135 start_codon:yes stop_codon:yes gene_type:complete
MKKRIPTDLDSVGGVSGGRTKVGFGVNSGKTEPRERCNCEEVES